MNNNQKLNVRLVVLVVALIGSATGGGQSKRKGERPETEQARQELIQAVSDCGGNVEAEIEAAGAIRKEIPKMTMAQAYHLHTTNLKLDCK